MQIYLWKKNLYGQHHDISHRDDQKQKRINCSSILGRLVNRYIKTQHWVSGFEDGCVKVGLHTMETAREFLRQVWSPQ